MAKTLAISNFSGSVYIDLLSDASTVVFFGEGGRRPLQATDGTITRTFLFRVTSTTKALARANVNAFITALRNAVRWNVDGLESESYFLVEGADGETVLRSLILNFEAFADVDGSAIDAYQSLNKEINMSVALTLLDHREEVAQKTLSESNATANYAVGKALILYGNVNTAPSRISVPIISSLVGNVLRSTWVGMKKSLGVSFQPVWFFDYADFLGAGTAETTQAGSYGTNVAKVSTFSTTTMIQRVQLNVGTQYTALLGSSAASGQASGRYVVLLRCLSEGGNVLVRVGVEASDGAPCSYNEARLLVDSSAWQIVNLGVVSLPPNSIRQEELANERLAGCGLWFDAQRLSGSATLVFDTITFIPHDHYMAVEGVAISSIYTTTLYTNENLDVGSIVKTEPGGDFATNGKIIDKNNFIFPPHSAVCMVYAADFGDGHIYNTNLDNGDIKIYEAFDAYNV